MFGRFVTEKDDPKHKGQINLKHTGTLPLVEGLRLLGLREGVRASSSLARIAALHDAGVLDGDEQDYLRGAYNHITMLLLRQQIRDFEAGTDVSNYVPPSALTKRERDILYDGFKAIREFRGRLRTEFTGDIF